MNVIQSEAILRSPSEARRSKAKRGITFMSEWGQKTDFQASFNENHSELSHTMAYRSLFHSNQCCEIGVWQRRGNIEGLKQILKTTS